VTASFDLLVSADLLVDDVVGTSERLVRALGLPTPRASWLQDLPDEQHQVNWLRVQADRGAAPTAIEVIGPHPDTGWAAPLKAAAGAQGSRPMKTHNTVVGISDPTATIALLTERGVPHAVDPGEGLRPFPRIWVGVESQHGSAYDPAHDAGLMLEFLPTSVLGLPEPAVVTKPGQPGSGAALRVHSRSFLVDDLELAVASLQRSLDWEPAALVTVPDEDGTIRATFAGSRDHGAALELLQPVSATGAAADHRQTHGAGAYRITLAVAGIEAAASGLTARGVDHARLGDRIQIAPESLGGLLFDLVDVADLEAR
jgi:hypothetical protein